MDDADRIYAYLSRALSPNKAKQIIRSVPVRNPDVIDDRGRWGRHATAANHAAMELFDRLGKLINIPPVSIEFVPGDGSDWEEGSTKAENVYPFLFSEGHLGVPQKLLYKAYLVAIPVFMRLKKGLGSDGLVHPSDTFTESISNSCAVILLANPAHQTALNVRKRLVQSTAVDARHELEVTTALLTSILWHHRRWLLRHVFAPFTTSTEASAEHGADSLINVDMTPEAFQEEFAVTAKACETYHRNYYAWIHRYICLESLTILARSSSPFAAVYHSLLVGEFTSMRRWVELHVSDYTAVQYLCAVETFFLGATHPGSSRALPSSVLDAPPMLDHAASLVESFPDHETLWLYLRASTSVPRRNGTSDRDTRNQLLSFARRYITAYPSSSAVPQSLTTADSPLIHRHACRLVAWLSLQQGLLTGREGQLARHMIAGNVDNQEILRELSLEQ
ncbi:uncharacterized protein LAESUDRAFT_797368 [Laetiporus sulphureus 93-53]|uniref:Protein prenylyltransferase n=1 Tax=Laetiporus sulphureus 93-53 TaxID=1314785 RepID=A0A165BQF1_9APHY|nr:uncharacterized protein LAESUDRAFT_797368 [Laetiporus sulphureus 93-53]KZT01464.1 hypothetical protein LAESUDRAFT_797368 [Laetiporus sulphureus 93-53]